MLAIRLINDRLSQHPTLEVGTVKNITRKVLTYGNERAARLDGHCFDGRAFIS
jgi:hypothetical protein